MFKVVSEQDIIKGTDTDRALRSPLILSSSFEFSRTPVYGARFAESISSLHVNCKLFNSMFFRRFGAYARHSPVVAVIFLLYEYFILL